MLNKWIRAAFMQRSGSAGVEFVLVAPLLALLLAGIAEIGLAIRTNFKLQEALLVGANLASHKVTTDIPLETAVKAIMRTSVPELAEEKIIVTRYCGCVTATATLALTRTNLNVCTNDCAYDQLRERKYITIEAKLQRPMIFSQSFGLPNDISAAVTTRVP